MASKLNAFLNQLGDGLLKPKGQMADWQHASRTFVDDDFRLAPKVKFLYHVYFDINQSALKYSTLSDRHKNEIGILAKSVDFPRFTLKTVTLNQYNRKKIIQTTHDYAPLNFKFHDDRANVINNLWQNYYAYYYADPMTATAPGSYDRNAMKPDSYIIGPYGLDNNSSIPFFNEIILYQLNNRQFASYTLKKPVITAFNHDNHLSSDQGAPSECNMTIAYEAVTYDVGMISSGNVKGFAQEHYDKTPSPLTAAGGGTRSIFGTGGVLDGAFNVFDAVSSGKAFSSAGNLLNTTAAAINTYQNAKNLTGGGIKQEGQKILAGVAVGALGVAAGAVSTGLKNLNFPSTKINTKTQANPMDFP
jgi:hypothetical protein